MLKSLRVLILLLGLSTTFVLPAPAQPADSLLQGTFWKTQGLQTILPAWTEHARTDEGVFFAELDRTWTPQDSTTQYPGMVARHVFSYAAAYLMSGDEAHLRHAEAALDFMIEHGWDERHGGWYNAVSRSGEVVDAEKDLFMQIYATTGLALYSIVTRDDRAQTYLRRTRQFMEEHAWDDEHGGYVDVLRRDGSVKADVKDFSPQLAPLSGYLLYLYPATRDSTDLRQAEEIMDLTLTHMQDDRGWILERFATDWTFLPDDGKNSHINVGHNLEVAWLLLRLYALTGNEAYRTEGLALTDKLLKRAFHAETGAWRSKLKRTDPSQFPNTTTWWTQAYGNFLQLYAYRVTGRKRYLRAFRSGAHFWTDHFVDEKHGGTVLRAFLDGGVAGGRKAVRTKTSYHALEHSLLAYLYLDLWVNESPVTLHYQIEDPNGERLYPLPVEDLTPKIERVTINGTPQTPPDTADGALRLPEKGPAAITIQLTSPSPTP
jgi:mannobiose 2-epimerase